jgi:hypothetical protein
MCGACSIFGREKRCKQGFVGGKWRENGSLQDLFLTGITATTITATTAATATITTTPGNKVLPEKLRDFQPINNSPHFMETEGSLPHSQGSAFCPYPEQARSSPCPPSHFFRFILNIILPSMPRSFKWSRSLRFLH